MLFILLTGILPWRSPRPFQIRSFRAALSGVRLPCVAPIGWFHVVMLQVALIPVFYSLLPYRRLERDGQA